jgi:serine phosphatase RsbU (regulator of sigma subunit)/anti-sigma regulatory factor (Ser/Thr protein kinase)
VGREVTIPSARTSRRDTAASDGGSTRSAWTNVGVVILIGVLITGALVIGARNVHESNERRLLDQRVREVGAVLSAAIPTLTASLDSIATVATATNGDAATFESVTQPIVTAGQPFDSIGLWQVRPDGSYERVLRVGKRSELSTLPAARVGEVFKRAARAGRVTKAHPAPTFAVADLLDGPRRRLGYAYVGPRPDARYVVSGERTLSRNRRARVDKDSAFSDLDYALFVGRSPASSHLIASRSGTARLAGRTGSMTVPFGDTTILLVISPRKDLGGSLLTWLPWILGAFGALCTAAAACTVWRLSKRRNEAERLAFENERLYADQRSVAQTLQHSLLPQTLPEAAGLEFGAIYAPGTEGIDIGGDWYEVVTRTDGTTVVVVGDVSGHGLDAATMMASLRFAIRAYAADGDGPGAILSKLTHLVNVGRDGHFATVLCGVIDPSSRTATWADAGHPRPLVVGDGVSRFVPMPVGPPIGVVAGAEYAESSDALPADGLLLLYTDGLVERRGETIDVGFERLADAARRIDVEPLADALFSVVRRAIPDGCDDDAALLGIRWRSEPAAGPGHSASTETFPATPDAVTDARSYATDALDGAPVEVVETVALLVSELATNSVRHAAAGFTLGIDRRPDRIRVAVSDAGPGDPQVRTPEPVEPSGRGLQIVEALSDDWGCTRAPDGTGKTVWFEIAAAPAPASR